MFINFIHITLFLPKFKNKKRTDIVRQKNSNRIKYLQNKPKIILIFVFTILLTFQL